MKTYKPRWTTLPRSIRKEYEQGATVLDLAIKYQIDAISVRRALVFFGTKIRSPGGKVPGRDTHQCGKLSDDDILLILKLDKENVPHQEIARRIVKRIGKDLSRERIRQICAKAGHPTRASRMIPKTDEVRATRLANQQARHEKIRLISEAWKAGDTFRELSLLIFGDSRTSANVCSRITQYRVRYGKELFPYRRKNHWSIHSTNWRVKRIQNLSKAWKESGGDIRLIQKQFGYNDVYSAHTSIQRLRKRLPDLFPSKEEVFRNRVIHETKNQTDKTRSIVTQDNPIP